MAEPSIQNNPTEYSFVFMLNNYYVAAVSSQSKIKIISKHPEKLQEDAKKTAKIYAETKKISYQNTLKKLSKPIYTVIKNEGLWYPAELHSDKICILNFLGSIFLGGRREKAIGEAEFFASEFEADFLPSIGISLSQV